MKVVLFKNVIGEGRPAMDLYPDELLKHMPLNVEGFTIKAKRLPFVAHYFHKELVYPKVATNNQGDVNHISDHSYAGLIKYLDPQKTIITCHDLIPLDNPGETSFLGRQRYWFNVKWLPRAANIIAVSGWTKKCILKHFDYPEEKIHVIYEGVSEKIKPLNNKIELKNKYNIKLNTILHVGTSFPRKNIDIILNLLVKRPDLMLLKVGEFAKRHKSYIKENKLESRIRQFVGLHNDRLLEIYNLADALVMPSFAEGFGWPVLEAMGCGCPVICSDIEVFRELHDGVAVFVNPNDVDDLGSKLDLVLNRPFFKDDLIKKGLGRIKSFSWETCAQQTYKIYEEVYNERTN
ncbi:MAG: glycosyltransferase family 4 protein [Candidatus Omnitrophota bacterium]|nr:MAG: glycosyltransferase family 4 protein [Candidatus Omnitrophota bacterium]